MQKAGLGLQSWPGFLVTPLLSAVSINASGTDDEPF
jgi:hypothetical protein